MAGADRGERAAEQDGGESQVAGLEIPQSGLELGFTPTVMEMAPAGRMGAWDTSVLRKASWCSAGGWQWVTSQQGGWLDRPPTLHGPISQASTSPPQRRHLGGEALGRG